MPPDLRLLPGYGLGGVLDPAPAASAPPGGAGGDDAYWMRRALLRAMEAEGRASPNPTVGAVIVKDGVLIAEGATEPYGGRHAERCAIDSVADRAILRGATIYTTLEPCAHWGKQPPCADLVASCGFARCVSALRDPDPRVAGVGLDRIRAAGTEVAFGPLRDEIQAWHLPYLTQRLTGRPLISALGPAATPHPYRDRLRHQCDILITALPAPPASGFPAAAQPRSGLPAATPPASGFPTAAPPPSGLPAAPPPASGVPAVATTASGVSAAAPPVPGVPVGASPAAGSWRGVIWWDPDGRTAQLNSAETRRLSAHAQALGVPVILVGPHPADLPNVAHVVRPAGPAASWLRAYSASAELAAAVGEQPNWLLIDDCPELAVGDALEVFHAFDRSPPPSGDLVEITRDELIAEYCAKELLSVLAGTPW
ncbi:hypothetical protein ACGFJ7_32410 [Actinoplanes sp. NPDC048988]|uniref:hypothetical protein n=1 Tax=Actinoplanes sp. NPDC048988 TaxID=3363901 RepID=UPI00371FB081